MARVTSEQKPEKGLPFLQIPHRKLYVKLSLFGETAALLFFNVRFNGFNDPGKCRRIEDTEPETVSPEALPPWNSAECIPIHRVRSAVLDYSINQARLKA